MSTIHERHYTRRCKTCWYTQGWEKSEVFPLPRLSKKVIYLDQFAISNMMKSLNPQTRAFQEKRVDKFWRNLYEKLDVLVGMQLIISPDSTAQENESLMSGDFYSYKRLYEHLSCGTSLKSFHDIRRHQLYQNAMEWLQGNPTDSPLIDPLDIFHRSIDVWHDRFYISFPRRYLFETQDHKRKSNEEAYEILKRTFARWQSDKHTPFSQRFREECMSIGPVVLRIWEEHVRNLTQLSLEGMQDLLGAAFGPITNDYVLDVQLAYERLGYDRAQIHPKVSKYFHSSALCDIPFNKIHSLLAAALARKAMAGQKRLPTPGMLQDFETISVLLPYCDAMILDKECHALLSEAPLNKEIDYGTLIFSLNNKEDLIGYLSNIASSASEEHIQALNEVYGESWRKPNIELFK